MNSLIIDRVLKEANWIIKTNDTVRQTANVFNISKSTVHKDLHERLLYIDYCLFEKIDIIFKKHISTRHIKGGESTKMKYKRR